MKALIFSPHSVKSKTPITTTTPMEESQSWYFPGCRKDANCSCEICLDSINAILDLMPMSVQKSSLTRLSASKPGVETTPVLIDPTLLSTTISRTPVVNPRTVPTPTQLKSTAKSSCPRIGVDKKRSFRFGLTFLIWVLFLGLACGLEFTISWGVMKVLRPRLSDEIVRSVVVRSWDVKSLTERLLLIQKGLKGYVGDQVSNCNLGDSSWKIDQDGLILNSHCILYQSAAEEVIVWGSPLGTAGLLTAGFTSRTFTLLSGRVIEWPEGQVGNLVRERNSTWVRRRWSASLVRFEPNTWIVEYKQNLFQENPSVCLAAVEFFKFWTSSFMERIKRHFWLLHGQTNHVATSLEHYDSNIPT